MGPLVLRSVSAAAMLVLCTSACNDTRTPVTPSGSTPPVATPGGTGSAAVQYHISGTVRNDSGAPVAGATVDVQAVTSSTPGTNFTYLSTRTDQTGRYTLAFSSVPGALGGPESVRENLVAFVWVWPDGSTGLNGDFQYVN